MRILYIGDVMGEAGIETVEKVLPGLVNEKDVDFVIAQAENVSEGKGLTVADYERLKRAGVQAFTGGNWTMHLDETHELLEGEEHAVTRPANYPDGTAGKRYKIAETSQGKVLLISLLGSIVGKDADKPTDNPLASVDGILNMLSISDFTTVIVNFHGDFSSEKVVIGHYLDGRVTAVIGDHWHVPTADARVLKGGTAHITDVGMVGSLDSSLGVKFESVLPRWRDGIQTRNVLETEGAMQFNAVLVETNPETNRAKSIEQIRIII
ncbi:MAG: Calcineurin-like phosphoesterase [Candidatus Saccharibacteria bacterium]|nr:Calcineurin-like phosphoesterase [Candidatus Saccharibacteria bacterium]